MHVPRDTPIKCAYARGAEYIQQYDMTSVGEEHRFRYQSAKEEELEHEIIYPEEEERVLTYRHLLSTTYEPTYVGSGITPSNPFRVIAHCDVDAAYAQCMFGQSDNS